MLSQKNRLRCLLLLFILCPLFRAIAVESTLEEALITVSINGEGYSSVINAYKDTNSFYISEADMLSYRIKKEFLTKSLITINNKEYSDISKLKGVKFSFISTKLLLDIYFPPEYFITTSFSYSKDGKKAEYLSGSGGYFNYGVSYNGYKSSRYDERNVNLLPEFVLFNDYGAGSTNFFLQKTLHGSKHIYNLKGLDQSKAIRLDTFWFYESPDNMHRIRLGDSITRATLWSGAARFIGIKFARDFTVQPGFITSPRPSISGTAAVPSAVDVFVNNVKVQSGQTPPGNFFLENIPVINGAGIVELQMRDITGNVNVIHVPYYASESLLKTGLDDYALDIGKTREFYGIKSNSYRNYFASGIYRYGVTNYYTAGIYGQIMEKLKMASFDNAFLVGNYGTINLSLAGSQKFNKSGNLVSVGFQRQSDISFGGLITINSRHFGDVSTFPHSYFSQRNTRAYMGTSLGNYGAINTSFTLTRDRKKYQTKLLDIAYQKQLLPSTNLLISAGRNFGDQKYTFAFLSINVDLGDSRSASVSVEKHNNKYREVLDYSKNSGTINGLDYRLQVAHEYNPELHAEARYSNKYADTTGRVSKYRHFSQYYANAQGSAFVANNDIYFSRPIAGCIAVIKVDDYEGINVYKDNHHIGQTNEGGMVAIYGIQSYTPSTIRVNTTDLPIHAKIDTHERTVYCKSNNIIFVPFGVKKSKVMTFHLIDDNGNYIQSSTKVQVGNKEAFTGYHGMVFLDDISNLDTMDGKACKNDSCCNFSLSIPDDGESEYINLGDVKCTK